ncbi:DUF4013 domain-containing protein [Haloarchaeobius sp. HRN-SO-5]|uniref:DUF4013 domain-containing protein n=1 Tax=Haloarchaeobius sp. HRN-SO-5 TaxID=3446118 RepID=UPI003EBCD49B
MARTNASTRDSDRFGRDGLLEFAVGYPRTVGWRPTLVGGLLVLLSILVLPVFVLLGYQARLGRSAANGWPQPELVDVGDLFVEGLKLFAVLLPPVLLFAGVYATFVLGGTAVESDALVTAGGLVVLVLYLLLVFLVPALQTGYYVTGSVTRTFTSGVVTDFAFTGYYVKATLVYLVLVVVANVVYLVSIVTIVGPLFVAAFFAFAQGSFWGYAYYRAAERGIVPPPSEFGPDTPPGHPGEHDRTAKF